MKTRPREAPDDKARNYPPPGSQDDPQTADAQDEPVRAPGPAIAAHLPAPGSELLVNGSFEDGATAWLLNGAELVPDAGSAGTAALAIRQGTWKTAEQRIAAWPNTRYTVSGHLRTEQCNAPVGILALFVDEFGHELGRRLVSPAVWGTTAGKRYSIQAHAPSATRFLDVRLYSSEGGTGQAFFDELSVVPLGK